MLVIILAGVSMVALTAQVGPLLIRSLLCEGLIRFLSIGIIRVVFLLTIFDPIMHNPCPITLCCISTRVMLPRPRTIMILPLESISCPLWGRPELSLVTNGCVRCTLLAAIESLNVIHFRGCVKLLVMSRLRGLPRMVVYVYAAGWQVGVHGLVEGGVALWELIIVFFEGIGGQLLGEHEVSNLGVESVTVG